MSKKITKSDIVKAQQAAVTELDAIASRLERLLDGIGTDGKWFPRDDLEFVEGQVNTMLGVAAEQIRNVLSAFEDCAEDGVKVPEA